MLISLETAQLHAGVSTPLLKGEEPPPEYFDKTWIYYLHRLVTENKLQIDVHK